MTDEEEQNEDRIILRVQLSVGGMTCSSCSATVHSALISSHPDATILHCSVDVISAKAIVEMKAAPDNEKKATDALVQAVTNVGFDATVLLVSKVPTTKIKYQFALEGLTCAACVDTVQTALSKLPALDHVQVSLFPEPNVRCEGNSSHNNDALPELVMDTVENVGFGATLVSAVTTTTNTTATTTRDLIFTVPSVQHACTLLENHAGVESVQILDETTTGNKKKDDAVAVFPKDNRVQEEEATMDDPPGRIRAVVQSTTVRTIARVIQATTITDAVGIAAHEQADRRAATLQHYRRAFWGSALLAIPVAFISMGIGMIPTVQQQFLHKTLGFVNITWEELLTWVLTTPVQFGSGARFYRESYYSLRTGHWGMGLLICVGTSAAYFYSVFAIFINAVQDVEKRLSNAFETSALLIMFVLLGKYLEHKAKGRTSKAIADLVELSPESASLVGTWSTETNTEEACPQETIPLVLVQPDDILLVRPGEKVPSDGVIVNGAASIDESMLTGESIPVSKFEEDTVIGGTINLDGSIRVRVRTVGGDTTLSQIIRLVDEAQSCRAPIQDFADWISARFVPAVMIAALATFVIWTILFQSKALDGVKDQWNYADHGLNEWTLPLIFSISVLVISCPCAVGLATPTAIMVGTGVGAKHGILMKGGEPLEAASRVDAIVFDKTGTLTFGKPTVADVLLLSDKCANIFDTTKKEPSLYSDLADMENDSSSATIRAKTMENVFFFAASAEYGSEHPLAKGIMAKAELLGIGDGLDRTLVRPNDFVSETGKGVKCTIEGHQVHLGNRRCLESNDIQVRPGTLDSMTLLEKKGQTAVVLSVDGETEAVIGLIDQAKDEAALAINVLRKFMGVDVYMLTGDNFLTAAVVAASIGLDPEFVVADVLPEGKVDCIKRLQAKYNGSVAMVGDGVNDSPALAQADIGMAVGAGTNIAMETAGIVLVNSKLTDVVTATHLARTIYRRIRLNFVWALGYNTLAIPLGAGVFYPLMNRVLPPFVAGIAMILSSMTVLLSSLHLNQYRPPQFEKEYESNRDGQVRLKRVHMKAHDGIGGTIECNCSLSGVCSCPPGQCQCYGCNMDERNKDLMPEAPLSETRYPGCNTLWGKGCACGENCRCGGGCCQEDKEVITRLVI